MENGQIASSILLSKIQEGFWFCIDEKLKIFHQYKIKTTLFFCQA
jgi:hypothetical protein